jgi:hypothetical protein
MEISTPKQLLRLWEKVQEAGGACFSSVVPHRYFPASDTEA